jgi:hypothetical protein
VQSLTIIFLLTICPCDCLENRHGSSQVSSEKPLWKQPTIAAIQIPKTQESPQTADFLTKRQTTY